MLHKSNNSTNFERSRTENSILNILTGMVGYFINTIVGFGCRIVFVHCLSSDYLGVNGLFTNILSMLSLAELGIGSAIVYALYKPIAKHDEKKIASIMKVYEKAYKRIGIFIGLIGFSITPFLTIIVKEQPNIIESLYVLYFINLFNTVITYFYSYRSTLIIAAQQNYIVASVNYVITILQSIIQVIFLLLTHNYLIYLLIQTLGTVVYNVIISYIAVQKYPFINKKNIEPLPKEEKDKLFQNVKDLMYYKVSSLLVNSTDNILITFFKGLSITGIASNYTLIVTTINSLLTQVFNGLTASVGNHNALETKEKKYQMFSFINLMNFWIFGWAAIGIIFCSSDVVELCFGDKYILSIWIPLVMALNFYSVGMMNAVWTYKHTMGLFHYGRFLQIITGVLNIVFSIFLGNKYGLFGILIATFIARSLTSFWYDPYAVYKYGFELRIWVYMKKCFYYLTVMIVTSVVNMGILYPLNDVNNLVLKIIFKIIVCSFVTNVVFILAFYKKNEFKKMRDIIKNMCRIIRKSGNV